MRKILYASLSMNGLVLVQEGRTTPPPVEVMQDFMLRVKRAGNLVLGRVSASPILSSETLRVSLSPAKIVVVSETLPTHNHDADHLVARSPEDALAQLASAGFDTAFIGGGAIVYNAFLERGLVDALIINLCPEIASNGNFLTSRPAFPTHFKLVEIKQLSRDVTQLHYTRDASGNGGPKKGFVTVL
ncbi:dihydrofolate reductase family protein [Pseudochryseolinea flava]|nr:dihydrofolate reductase family protein [Pseudochryseolinea flava]